MKLDMVRPLSKTCNNKFALPIQEYQVWYTIVNKAETPSPNNREVPVHG